VFRSVEAFPSRGKYCVVEALFGGGFVFESQTASSEKFAYTVVVAPYEKAVGVRE
jgi:hypothetical protein